MMLIRGRSFVMKPSKDRRFIVISTRDRGFNMMPIRDRRAVVMPTINCCLYGAAHHKDSS
jgi:hypothetical protein